MKRADDDICLISWFYNVVEISLPMCGMWVLSRNPIRTQLGNNCYGVSKVKARMLHTSSSIWLPGTSCALMPNRVG